MGRGVAGVAMEEGCGGCGGRADLGRLPGCMWGCMWGRRPVDVNDCGVERGVEDACVDG